MMQRRYNGASEVSALGLIYPTTVFGQLGCQYHYSCINLCVSPGPPWRPRRHTTLIKLVFFELFNLFKVFKFVKWFTCFQMFQFFKFLEFIIRSKYSHLSIFTICFNLFNLLKVSNDTVHCLNLSNLSTKTPMPKSLRNDTCWTHVLDNFCWLKLLQIDLVVAKPISICVSVDRGNG